jgi:hypothetical protein
MHAREEGIMSATTFRLGRLFGKVLTLTDTTISLGKETHPLAGVTASLETSGSRRMSMPNYIEIEGPGFAWSEKSDHAHEGKARRFVQAVNLAARQAQPAS